MALLCAIGGITGCSSSRDGSPVVAGTVNSPVTASDPSAPSSPSDAASSQQPGQSDPGASSGTTPNGTGANGTSADGQANSDASGSTGQGSSSGASDDESNAADTRQADCALTAGELKRVHDTLSGFVSNPPTDPDVATSNLNAAASAVGATKGKAERSQPPGPPRQPAGRPQRTQQPDQRRRVQHLRHHQARRDQAVRGDRQVPGGGGQRLLPRLSDGHLSVEPSRRSRRGRGRTGDPTALEEHGQSDSTGVRSHSV